MEANQAQVLTCAFLGSQTTNPRLPESKYYRNLVSWVASVSVTVVSLAVTHHAADYGTRTRTLLGLVYFTFQGHQSSK